jgi:hypothetical protein
MKIENKRIWTPFKIWDETQWFNNIDSLIEICKKDRNKKLLNNFWNKKRKK